MATTLFKLVGSPVAAPPALQPTTVPSACNARLWPLPAEMATTLVVAGIFPNVPQPTMVPSPFNARLCVEPAAMATTLLKPAGGTACEPEPQPTTVPFASKVSS